MNNKKDFEQLLELKRESDKAFLSLGSENFVQAVMDEAFNKQTSQTSEQEDSHSLGWSWGLALRQSFGLALALMLIVIAPQNKDFPGTNVTSTNVSSVNVALNQLSLDGASSEVKQDVDNAYSFNELLYDEEMEDTNSGENGDYISQMLGNSLF